MGLGTRFDPWVIEVPVGVVGGLLDELVGALAKPAKGGEGDRLEVDVQALVLDDLVRVAILVGGHLVGGETTSSSHLSVGRVNKEVETEFATGTFMVPMEESGLTSLRRFVV